MGHGANGGRSAYVMKLLSRVEPTKCEAFGIEYETIEVPGEVGASPFVVVLRDASYEQVDHACRALGEVQRLAGCPVVNLRDGAALEIYAVLDRG